MNDTHSEDDDEFVHPEMLRILGYELPSSLEEILTFFEGDDLDMRRIAAHELGNFNSPAVVEKLHGALNDPDKWIRVCSIEALANLDDKTVVKPLCEILEQSDIEYDIRSNALRALADLRDPRAMPTLIKLLASENAFTRYDAAFALGEIGDPDAIEHLKEIVSDTAMPEENDNDTIWSVGENAQKAIDKILGLEEEDEDWDDSEE